MNQRKFSLADVLAVATAIAFSFIFFLGANFLNIGKDKVWGMHPIIGCIVMALLCSVLLFATAFGAKLLKRTSRDFITCFVGEVILLTLFVTFAVFFATKTSPFTHYFTVMVRKLEINSKLQTSITQAESMFAEYESYAENRERMYRETLKSVAEAKRINPNQYRAYGFQDNGISDDRQIETKMFTLHADLFPANYSVPSANNGIKEVATEWLQNAKSITTRWKPIGIVGVVNEIEKNSTDWLNTLVKLSIVREQNEQASDFEYHLPLEAVKTYFTKPARTTGLSLGLAVVAYILMSLSWIVTKRSTRFPGLKFLFGLGKSGENEL